MSAPTKSFDTRTVSFWAFLQLPAFAALELLFRLWRPFDPDFVHVDVQLYFNAAQNVIAGRLPYRDFFFPYPPGSLVFFIPPALISSDATQYFRIFELEVLLLDWIALAVTAFIALRFGQSLTRTLLLYTLAIPAMGFIIWQRYDMAPALIVLLAFAAFIARRSGLAWALLAFGTLVKIYPVLLAPLFAIEEYSVEDARAPRGIIVFVAIVALGLVPVFIASFEETANIFLSQTGRRFEIESVGASLMIMASWIGLPAQIVYQRKLNTWDVDSPASGALQLVSLVLQVATIAFLYWRFLHAQRADATALIRYSLTVIAVSLLTAKVFSPQFILWLFPLAMLSGEKKSVWASVLFLIAAVCTQLAFPFLWEPLKQGSPIAVGALLVRDVALVVMAR
jgi:hypothetical protein